MKTVVFLNFDQAIKAALAWLHANGVTHLDEAYESRRGGFGMRTLDRSGGYRIEFDDRSQAHINVWSHHAHGPHLHFPGNENVVKSLWRQLFYWDPRLKRRGVE